MSDSKAIETSGQPASAARRRVSADLAAEIRSLSDGRGLLLLSAPNISCGKCIAAVEQGLARVGGVVAARVNLTLRRVSVTLESPETDAAPVVEAMAALGYPATPVSLIESGAENETRASSALLRRIAVAGFGATNIMLMSIAVWAGADGATRETFHLVSALIALPVAAYAGWPFFTSAVASLRGGRMNMDVPIALAILLSLSLSIHETAQGGRDVFFDAATTLIFFLLIGRYLDQRMRERARAAVAGIARLAAKGAMVLGADGAFSYTPLERVRPGMTLRVAPGERMPVDVRVLDGGSDIDRSLVTGESIPVSAGPGDELEAGALNLTGALDVEALRAADDSFLAEMMRMLDAAELGRGRYVRIADRAARLYSPLVHTLALAAFIGWFAATGDARLSIFIAISVLIITCPCALALAAPVAHVVAASRLLAEGIMMKDGSALERLAEVDHAVFDKTGTLTTGTPRASGGAGAPAPARAAAMALALRSTHPASGAVAAHLGAQPAPLDETREIPGCGVEGRVDGRRVRLGRADWAAEINPAAAAIAAGGPVFAAEGGAVIAFSLAEDLRPGAARAVAALRDAGLGVEILSGDSPAQVARVAAALGDVESRSGVSPAEKIARLGALRDAGRRTLMVGDGLNDAAALAAAHVSMAPASAADAGRLAADYVFLRDGLDAVPLAHRIATRTARVVRQNFGIAIVYNCIAVPLAAAGQVTPLVAALAMSASSIVVVGNSLRLNRAVRLRRAAGARRLAPLEGARA
ncbi:heavy metal translocating P-type ATPase [Pikeienuella sp. HZG-20]|uniref:heavy metal translocating P-type ATPase n=1 Tax=Paludibacillus litoralis TaxID=3133267 RepID=UPI0030EE1599